MAEGKLALILLGPADQVCPFLEWAVPFDCPDGFPFADQHEIIDILEWIIFQVRNMGCPRGRAVGVYEERVPVRFFIHQQRSCDGSASARLADNDYFLAKAFLCSFCERTGKHVCRASRR